MSRIKVKVEKRHFERAHEIRDMYFRWAEGKTNKGKFVDFMGTRPFTFQWCCFCPIALALKEGLGFEENDPNSVSVTSSFFRLPGFSGGELTKKAKAITEKVDELMKAEVSKAKFVKIMKPTTLQLELD